MLLWRRAPLGLLVLAALVVAATAAAAAATATAEVVLVVAYCPTAFTGGGAVVAVDAASGAWTVRGTWKWPSAIVGCPVEADPTVTVDNSTATVYAYFEDEQLVVAVDLQSASVVLHEATGGRDPFFTGFENMVYNATATALLGVAATVEQTGLCNDGCFMFGELPLASGGGGGGYRKRADILFKAMQDDVAFVDAASQTFWVQGSYDLRPQKCAPAASDECLLAIDMATGELQSAVWTANWTAYRYGRQLDADGNVLAWMFGFDGLCRHPDEDFVFGKVNLATAVATPGACMQRNASLQYDEWIAAFSPDESQLATASGSSLTGDAQLLVLDVATGAALLDTQLSGLGKALHTYQGIYAVWAIDWLAASA